MSSASARTGIAAALTVTINSETSVTYNPASGEVNSGGVVQFLSGNSGDWEIQLFNKENNDAHPMRLLVPTSGGAEMVADPTSLPREVKFNAWQYPDARGRIVTTGGAFTIKITSGDGATK
jgi:hypothetical protein